MDDEERARRTIRQYLYIMITIAGMLLISHQLARSGIVMYGILESRISGLYKNLWFSRLDIDARLRSFFHRVFPRQKISGDSRESLAPQCDVGIRDSGHPRSRRLGDECQGSETKGSVAYLFARNHPIGLCDRFLVLPPIHVHSPPHNL